MWSDSIPPRADDGVRVWPWRRAALVALPVAAALGPYAVLPGHGLDRFNGFRILVAAMTLGILLEEKRRPQLNHGMLWPIAMVGALTVSWGLCSVAWSPVPSAGIEECAGIAIGFLTLGLLVGLSFDDEASLVALRHGWVLAYVLSVGIAAWELKTGHHLPGIYYEQRTGIAGLSRYSTAATFGNPNNFGAFIVVTVPVLLWELSEVRHRWARLGMLFLLLSAPALLVTTGARLSMLGLGLVAIVLFTFGVLFRPKFRLQALVLVAALLAVGVSLSRWTDRLGGLTNLTAILSELRYGGSSAVRVNLLRNGFDMLQASNGIGTGAGSFSYEILHGFRAHPVSFIVNPHNLGMEILSQYGIPAFAGAGILVVWIGLLLIRDVRSPIVWASRRLQWRCLTAFLIGVAYLAASSENSTYIVQPVNWLAVGTVMSLAATTWERATRGVKASLGRLSDNRNEGLA